MALTLTEIDQPEMLAAAWTAGEVSPWDAIAVLLHRVDHRTVRAWMDALPPDLSEVVREEVRQLALSASTYRVGRGAGLDERPEALAALLGWLYLAPPLAA